MELNPRRIVGGLNPLRVGVALMLVGGSTLGLGLVQTTTASMQPSCPGGTQLIAKFEWSGRHYDFDGPSGNGSVVNIGNDRDDGGTWTSTKPVSHLIVKGGPGSVTATFTPPASSGTFSNAGLPKVGGGNTPDISNVQFCGAIPPATTTTSTTTTVKPTTTKATTTTRPRPPLRRRRPPRPRRQRGHDRRADDHQGHHHHSRRRRPRRRRPPRHRRRPPSIDDHHGRRRPPSPRHLRPVLDVEFDEQHVDEHNLDEHDHLAVGCPQRDVDQQGRQRAGLADGTVQPLAVTGNTSLPLVIVGIVLLAAGAAMTVVTRLRTRRTDA